MSQRPVQGYVDPNIPNPMGENDTAIIIYGYTPSLAVGVLGVILFGISSILHGYQIFRYKTWYFIPIVVGTLMEIVGYICRILASRNPYNLIYFVIQYFFIVVAPVLLAAAIYTILSMLVKAVGRSYSPLPPRFILFLFIGCDIIATVVQVAGAANVGVAYSRRNDPTTANNILLAGLAFQVFSFFIFIVLLGTFLYRARKIATSMLPFTYALIAATLLVYLRTIIRLAETSEGLLEYLSSHEVIFGCLEFAPIVIAVFIFNIWHPGKWVPRYN